jgi:hypothetical protein
MLTIARNTKNSEYEPIKIVKPGKYYEALLNNSYREIDIDEKFHLLSKKVLHLIREIKKIMNQVKNIYPDLNYYYNFQRFKTRFLKEM